MMVSSWKQFVASSNVEQGLSVCLLKFQVNFSTFGQMVFFNIGILQSKCREDNPCDSKRMQLLIEKLKFLQKWINSQR